MSVDLLTTFDCHELSSPAMTHRTCLINRDIASGFKEGQPTVLGVLKVCLKCKEYAEIKAQHPDFKPYLDARGNTRYPGPSYAEQRTAKEAAKETEEHQRREDFGPNGDATTPGFMKKEEPLMTEFSDMTKVEKKAAILKVLDRLTTQHMVSPTKKNIAKELGVEATLLEYWFQKLKKEGVISIGDGGPHVSGTVSRVEPGDSLVQTEKITGCPECGNAWVDCVCDEPAPETKGSPADIVQPLPAYMPEVNQVVAPKKPGIMTGDPPSVERLWVKGTALERSMREDAVRCKIKEGTQVERGVAPSTPVHPCPHHPDRVQVVGKHGKRLGVCSICLSTRASTENLKRNHGEARVVQLFFPDKHLDLKAWLEQQADAEERDLKEQIFYTLKKGREALCQSK